MKRILLILTLLSAVLPVSAQIHIWEGTKEHARSVTLTPFLPEGKVRAAVIVCPGGSYFWHDMESEGTMVAEWLASEGIAAFVLKYRVGGVGDFMFGGRLISHRRRHPDQISDLQMAIRTVRERAVEFGIGDAKLGVMGFSAGGHLVMSAAELSGTDFLALKGVRTNVSLSPDFAVPVYPVVTFSDARYVHKRSRRGLLGEGRTHNRALRDSLSLEKHADRTCCPVFLVNCVDDPVVEWHNAVLLDSALTAAGKPHRYTLYQQGGHGFGANPGKQSPETAQWQESFIKWLENNIL